MEILKNFGVNPILLVAQIVNFLIVLYLLKKFLYKPVFDLLKKRRDTISEGLAQAEDARIKLEKVVEEEKNILRLAQTQAKKIIDQAKEEAIEVSKQITENAKKQTDKMIKDAQGQIARETSNVEKKLVSNVSKLAVSFLQKALSDFFSERQQKDVMREALEKIKKAD